MTNDSIQKYQIFEGPLKRPKCANSFVENLNHESILFFWLIFFLVNHLATLRTIFCITFGLFLRMRGFVA